MSEVEYTPLAKRPACRSGIVATVVAGLVALLVVLLLVLIPKYVKTGSTGPESPSTHDNYVIDGGWSDWKAWSTCSRSCDRGTQSRARTCSNPSPRDGGRDCVGNRRETRSCMTRACPDCSRPCPLGGTLTACAVCRCTGETYSGFVRDIHTNFPLEDVEVFSTHQLWNALAVTNGSGYFEVFDLCLHDPSLSIQFHKENYLAASTRVVAEEGDANVSTAIAMKKIEYPSFVLTPSDQAVYVGGAVNFSCLAQGDPEPSTYEWFHNGSLLMDLSSTGHVLLLTQVTSNQSGEYKCRAVTPQVKRFSPPAALTVTEFGEDTCRSTPSERWVTLPSYCGIEENGIEIHQVDLGECQPEVCSYQNETANPGHSVCCGPIRRRSLVVLCRGFNYNLVKIEQCGCAICQQSNTKVIRGTVFVQHDLDSLPLKGARFIYDGRREQTDNVTGTFLLEVPAKARRLVLQFPATSSLRIPQVKVLYLNVASHFEHKVILQGSNHVSDIDPSLNQTISFGGHTTMIKMTLRAGSVVSSQGALLDEMIHVYHTFTDPRERNNLDSANGEFRYITEEGNERHLLSYGVMQFRAVTSGGEPVLFNGDIAVEIHGHFLGLEAGDRNIGLWSLDTDSGRWREIKRIREYEGLILNTDLPTSGTSVTLAIAKPMREANTCALKVAVYTDSKADIPAPEVQVTVYTTSKPGMSYHAVESAITDQTGQACVTIPCGYIHEVVAQSPISSVHPYRKHRLPGGFPASNWKEEVKFQSPSPGEIQDGEGPVHRLSANTCQQPWEPDYQLQFYLEDPHDLGSLYASHPDPGSELSWYRVAADHPDHRVCMVRLDVVGGPPELDVIATSSLYSPSRRWAAYGTYVTALHSYHDEALDEHKVACILVRCANYNTTHSNVLKPYDAAGGDQEGSGGFDANFTSDNEIDVDDHNSKDVTGKSPDDYLYDYEYYGEETDAGIVMTGLSTRVDITMDSRVTTHDCHFSYTLGPNSPVTESSSVSLSLLLTPTQNVNNLDGYFTARGRNAYERTLSQCMTSPSVVAEYICDDV